ncbi:ureidoglycolate hydrolase [Bordetella petrii]|nr:ureidoglycolate hydrolase [Bordetella petrii]
MAARELTLQPLTPAAFQPYGDVIGSAGRAGRAINAGTSLRVEMPDPDIVDHAGSPSLSVFRAQGGALPFMARELERHRLGSQTFLPLHGTPYVVLVALGPHAPDPRTARAFLADGRCGITLRRGIWHHPLWALAAGDFAVLERRGPAVDCEIVATPGGPWQVRPAGPAMPGGPSPPTHP